MGENLAESLVALRPCSGPGSLCSPACQRLSQSPRGLCQPFQLDLLQVQITSNTGSLRAL